MGDGSPGAQQSHRDFEETRIDPFAYVRGLSESVSTHPQNQFAELLPDQ